MSTESRSTDDAAVFAVASHILLTHGGRRAAAWTLAEELVGSMSLHEIFAQDLSDLEERVDAANRALIATPHSSNG